MCGQGGQRDARYDTIAESKGHSNDLQEKCAKEMAYFYCLINVNSMFNTRKNTIFLLVEAFLFLQPLGKAKKEIYGFIPKAVLI